MLQYITKCDLTSNLKANYNMAGGFDGIGVSTASPPTDSHTA